MSSFAVASKKPSIMVETALCWRVSFGSRTARGVKAHAQVESVGPDLAFGDLHAEIAMGLHEPAVATGLHALVRC